MTAKTIEILEQLKSLTLLETAELVKQIEVTFDVDASVNKVIPITPIIDPVIDQDLPEFKTFDVVLEEVPVNKKIAILKVVRELTGFGLKEAKDLVESVPQVLKSAIDLDIAQDIKHQLESVGAKVSLK
ncbi:50S ribosomal protein L7/L12 [[Phormidium ambiguum] IAM M-71]|uniref:Large ribosomal subunit protein bL12 n=1 Tax=[Phormidium ambiguum] IAM M-71 TaxID=454136 RepID=A0A1U7IRP9_9CYAN|nr:50S ribosomal protein L7/L12 [Phormidium ambiguum]OKH40117.1 50S ribosomal protein L7/L12 [Phormidium ambiguum IAM M-71]